MNRRSAPPNRLKVALLGCALIVMSVARAGEPAPAYRQYRPLELAFLAEADCANPYDFDDADFAAEFRGPNGDVLSVPGFWDGARTWKIRFTPTAAGVWRYATRFSHANDRGLNQRHGELQVGGPETGHPLRQHGGFLKVATDRRSLTYTDGTPFFWLADTWWPAPSANIPLANFKTLVDTRLAQGYTVFQAHGYHAILPATDPFGPAPAKGIGAFEAFRTNTVEALQYWREADRYWAYADEKGIVGAIGFGVATMFDDWTEKDLQRLWRYTIARYGAYGAIFLITQEYNIRLGAPEKHIPKILALGAFIKATDPYKRAMTVHPWAFSRDLGQARDEPWLDFVMLQGGHRYFMKSTNYLNVCRHEPHKPVLEAEANYEGFASTNFVVDAAAVRRTAYTAIQSGCFGFSYGAQGLYSGVLSREHPGTTYKWGPVLTWEEGLRLAGGAQMQHLRTCYESVPWWRLEPRPEALKPAGDVLVKADGAQTLVLYYEANGKVPESARLTAPSPKARYRGEWFDPRTGQLTPLAEPLAADTDGLPLPRRPDAQDWVLLLRRE